MWEITEPILKDAFAILLTGVLTALTGFLIALAKKGFEWLSAKIDDIADERERIALADATNFLSNIVFETVSSLNQTIGDDIRESLKNQDGKYTREDLLALKDRAISEVMNQISEASKKILDKAYGNLNDYVSILIESSVRNLKLQEKTSDQDVSVVVRGFSSDEE